MNLGSSADDPTVEHAVKFISQNVPNLDRGKVNNAWDELWQQNYTPWDRGGPHPALTDIFVNNTSNISPEKSNLKFPPPVQSNGQRLRALVPGCGRGYDAVFLSCLGYDALGLDVSSSAVEACNVELQRIIESDWDGYPTPLTKYGRGEVKFLEGDFFSSEWENSLVSQRKFWDVIFDYKFLCALNPPLRPAWSKRYAQLINPDSGRLICAEFPTDKPFSTGGPPWACPSLLYDMLLMHPGRQMVYDTLSATVAVDDSQTLDEHTASLSPIVKLARWDFCLEQNAPTDSNHIVSVWLQPSGA